MSLDLRKQNLARDLKETRARTLSLMQSVPEQFFRTRVHDFYSPIGWHFGHVGMTEEFWTVHKAMREPCLDDRLSFLFANLPENPKDNRTTVPERAGILKYLERTRGRVLDALERADLDSDDPLLRDGYAWEFALQHECQHQETIAELLHLIHLRLPWPPLPQSILWESDLQPSFVPLAGDSFQMGSDDLFAYDNEKTAHPVSVPAFSLQSTPVTCRQWSRFMHDGAYSRRELWSPEGWDWRNREQVLRPMYWLPSEDAGGFYTFYMEGVRPLHPDEPVYGISWHEAEAFCRWSAYRLPSESEWEFAARSGFFPADSLRSPDALDSGPSPVKSPGITSAHQVWEWTASAFLPYPGFRAFPYDGYSLEHMDGNHRVCRGGSWITAPRMLRPSFRNWYVPGYRQGFLGVRCAL